MEGERKKKKGKKKRVELSKIKEKEINGNRESGEANPQPCPVLHARPSAPGCHWSGRPAASAGAIHDLSLHSTGAIQHPMMGKPMPWDDLDV